MLPFMLANSSSNRFALHDVGMDVRMADVAIVENRDEESTSAAKSSAPARTRASGIGRGASRALVETASQLLRNAPLHPDYTRHPQVPFIYEILDHAEITKEIAYQWVHVRTLPNKKDATLTFGEDEKNICRAEAIVMRKVPESRRSNPMNGYAAIRFKALPEEWKKGDHGILEGMGLTRGHETVVFIALEKWHRGNGCFTEMDIGEDVCMDSNAEVSWPGTGGGLGIFLSLKL